MRDPLALPLALALLVAASALAAPDPELAGIEARTGAKDPQRIELERDWGRSVQDSSSALSHFERVRELAHGMPGDVETVLHYIRVANTVGRLPEVREEVRSYASSHPEDPKAHYYLGMTDQEAARAHFRRALELDPGFYYAQVGMASHELTASTPDLAAAKSHLLDAARGTPDRALAFIVLEQLYRRTGDEDSRLTALAKAVEADPWDPRLRQMLLQQLQRQAQGMSGSRADLLAWIDGSNALLARLARLGDGNSELAMAAARLAFAAEQTDAALRYLELAAETGFADPIGLRHDPKLSELAGLPGAAAAMERIEANRARVAEDLKADALARLLDVPLPAVDPIPLLGGGQLDLASRRGKVVVLDFWATWCGPCRRSLPTLQQFYERRIDGVEVYCVNVFERDGGKSVEPFWKNAGYPMPVALGTDEWAQAFAVSSIPTLYVIGPDGRVRYRHQGFSPYLAEELGWIAEGLRGRK